MGDSGDSSTSKPEMPRDAREIIISSASRVQIRVSIQHISGLGAQIRDALVVNRARPRDALVFKTIRHPPWPPHTRCHVARLPGLENEKNCGSVTIENVPPPRYAGGRPPGLEEEKQTVGQTQTTLAPTKHRSCCRATLRLTTCDFCVHAHCGQLAGQQSPHINVQGCWHLCRSPLLSAFFFTLT